MQRRANYILLLMIILMSTACNSPANDAEVIPEDRGAAESVVSETPTKQPSQTPQPTATTIPCTVSVRVADIDGEAIGGAVISLDASSEVLEEKTVDTGEASFEVSLPGKYSLSVHAQGYLSQTQQVSLQSGENEMSFSLERDEFALMPSEILVEDEYLLYLEDFQDGQADFLDTRGEWKVIEDPGQPGNMLVQSTSDDKIALNIAELDLTNLQDVIVQYRFQYVDVDVTNTENWSGFNFRSYLTLDIAPYYRLYQVLDKQGEWFSPIQVNGFGFRSGSWYTARIEAIGPRLSIYLNDTLMGSAADVREDVIGADEKIINSFNLHAGPGSGVMYFDDLVVIEPAAE